MSPPLRSSLWKRIERKRRPWLSVGACIFGLGNSARDVCATTTLPAAHRCSLLPATAVLLAWSLDYAGMHAMTLHLGSPTPLLNGFYQLFESALRMVRSKADPSIGPRGNAAKSHAQTNRGKKGQVA